MSNRALTWARSLRLGSAAKKAVLMVLADSASDDDWATWLGQETIAAETELGLRTVRRALADLERDGVIVRRERRRPDGYRASDLIRLHAGWKPADPVDNSSTSPARESPATAAASGDLPKSPHRPESHLTLTTGSPATHDRLTGHSGRAENEPSVEPSVEPAANMSRADWDPNPPTPAAAAHSPPNPQRTLTDAARILAQRRAQRRHEVGPGWIHNATQGIANDHHQRAQQALHDNPTLTPEQLADLLEPPTPWPTGPPDPHPHTQTQAAAQARATRHTHIRTGHRCPHCDGTTWTFTTNGVTPCNTCNGTGTSTNVIHLHQDRQTA